VTTYVRRVQRFATSGGSFGKAATENPVKVHGHRTSDRGSLATEDP
jgi:hypothetical protein